MSVVIIGWLSLIVAVFGALLALYLTAPEGRRAVWIQIGLYSFAMGLLAFLLHVDKILKL